MKAKAESAQFKKISTVLYKKIQKNKLTSHVYVLITTILNNMSTRFAQLIRTVA